VCYGRRPMSKHVVWISLVLPLFVSGCNTVRNILGVPSPGDPTITLRSAEPRWLLVKNPRFGDVPSEPEYVWVEEDKVPWTFNWGVPGRAALAPPEIVARYGLPPGGGKIGSRQGVISAPDRSTLTAARAPVAADNARAVSAPAPPQPETPKRGFVVWVDTTRIVIDLTTQDGVQPGAVVSLRRDRIPIVHPITGERLGELDDEVATAKVTEIRDKFSVAEIQTLAQGAEVRVKDRVVVK
jgi:hypothetical protein